MRKENNDGDLSKPPLLIDSIIDKPEVSKKLEIKLTMKRKTRRIASMDNTIRVFTPIAKKSLELPILTKSFICSDELAKAQAHPDKQEQIRKERQANPPLTAPQGQTRHFDIPIEPADIGSVPHKGSQLLQTCNEQNKNKNQESKKNEISPYLRKQIHQHHLPHGVKENKNRIQKFEKIDVSLDGQTSEFVFKKGSIATSLGKWNRNATRGDVKTRSVSYETGQSLNITKQNQSNYGKQKSISSSVYLKTDHDASEKDSIERKKAIREEKLLKQKEYIANFFKKSPYYRHFKMVDPSVQENDDSILNSTISRETPENNTSHPQTANNSEKGSEILRPFPPNSNNPSPRPQDIPKPKTQTIPQPLKPQKKQNTISKEKPNKAKTSTKQKSSNKRYSKTENQTKRETPSISLITYTKKLNTNSNSNSGESSETKLNNKSLNKLSSRSRESSRIKEREENSSKREAEDDCKRTRKPNICNKKRISYKQEIQLFELKKTHSFTNKHATTPGHLIKQKQKEEFLDTNQSESEGLSGLNGLNDGNLSSSNKSSELYVQNTKSSKGSNDNSRAKHSSCTAMNRSMDQSFNYANPGSYNLPKYYTQNLHPPKQTLASTLASFSKIHSPKYASSSSSKTHKSFSLSIQPSSFHKSIPQTAPSTTTHANYNKSPTMLPFYNSNLVYSNPKSHHSLNKTYADTDTKPFYYQKYHQLMRFSFKDQLQHLNKLLDQCHERTSQIQAKKRVKFE